MLSKIVSVHMKKEDKSHENEKDKANLATIYPEDNLIYHEDDNK